MIFKMIGSYKPQPHSIRGIVDNAWCYLLTKYDKWLELY